MNIAIVGSGNVGCALGGAWRKAGHSVTFAAREPGGAKAAELKKAGFTVATTAEAAKGADIVVLATPWDAAPAAIKSLGSLAGKVVVDATNPLTAKLELALGFDDSAGETAADLGFEPVDVGPLAMSRHLEPMAMTWIKLAYAQGMGREFGFAVLRR
jgi:predicted dinucleotide-binding enzyme